MARRTLRLSKGQASCESGRYGYPLKEQQDVTWTLLAIHRTDEREERYKQFKLKNFKEKQSWLNM